MLFMFSKVISFKHLLININIKYQTYKSELFKTMNTFVIEYK